jgi:hypothetical protein
MGDMIDRDEAIAIAQEARESGETDMRGIIHAIRTLPATPVGVKPLEWRGAESDCFAEALVGEGCYQLTVSDSLERPCDYAWVAEYSENGRNPFTIIGHGSFADVVQIANQHRSAHILAALTPQPAPTLAEALELPEIKAQVEAAFCEGYYMGKDGAWDCYSRAWEYSDAFTTLLNNKKE